MSETPAPYSSANPKHTASRKRKDDRQKDHDRLAWTWVLSNEVGRHFVWLVLSEAGMFKQPFTGNSQTDFNCGRQDVGLKLHHFLSSNFPKEYAIIWQEHLTTEEEDRKIDEAARVNGTGESGADVREQAIS